MRKEDLDDITREKNLVEVYRHVTRQIPVRPFYRAVTAVIFVLLMLSGLASSASAVDLGARVREWSSFGFNFAATVLGILLAGFAIFTTITTSALVEPLATIRHKESGLSYLKYTAGHFMSIFIPYVVFLLLHGLIMLFGWYGGPVTKLVSWLSAALDPNIGRYAATLMLAIVGTFFAHMLIVLQSFVFNVYASFMFMAQGKLELDELERKKASEQGRTTKARIAELPNATEPIVDENVNDRLTDQVKRR